MALYIGTPDCSDRLRHTEWVALSIGLSGSQEPENSAGVLCVLQWDGEMPERTDLKLSDAFLVPTEGYEWTAHMLNINLGRNKSLMQQNKDYKPTASLMILENDWLKNKGIQFCEGILHEDNPFTFEVMLSADRDGYSSGFFTTGALRGVDHDQSEKMGECLWSVYQCTGDEARISRSDW